MTPSRILIVEDEAIVAMDLKLHLQELGYGSVDVASSGEEALEAAGRLAPDLVLMDISLGSGMDGIVAARHLQNLGIPCLLYTSDAADE